MDVGATLRRAREQKGFTLDQLSRATKISLTSLRALENNDFERLPAVVYTRGFLRSYAREVGLDPDDTVDQYLLQLEEALPIAMAEPEPAPSSQKLTEPMPHAEAAARAPTPLRIQIDLKSLPRPAMAAAALVLLAVIGLFVWRGGDDSAQVANAESSQRDAAQAAAQVPANDAAHAANVTDDRLRIELKATGPCWVSASADRSPALSRLLQAGESETIEAKDELVLRVGDPSTLSLTINGEPVRPLGRAATPVTVQINLQNYKSFVAEG
jgi:cytoskeletal protein RodZ